MANQKRPWVRFRNLSFLLISLTIGGLIGLANSPDFNLSFSRTVHSSLSPDRLDRQISSLSRWSQWFYSLANAKEIESQTAIPSPSREPQENDLISLDFDPKKGPWKKFQLIAKVKEYVPARMLKLEILEDSTHRLTRLFQNLEWKIEILPIDGAPENSQTLIRGTATARTQSWRARIFGRLAEKILMNQVFYPNLIKLASMDHPFSIDDPSRQEPSLLAR